MLRYFGIEGLERGHDGLVFLRVNEQLVVESGLEFSFPLQVDDNLLGFNFNRSSVIGYFLQDVGPQVGQVVIQLVKTGPGNAEIPGYMARVKIKMGNEFSEPSYAETGCGNEFFDRRFPFGVVRLMGLQFQPDFAEKNGK